MSNTPAPTTDAFPTALNSQITDAVTQTNVKVLADAPAVAMGSIYQSLAHATGILFENAVSAQQQQNTLAQAAANQGVMQIYSLDTAAAAGATGKVSQTGADNLAPLATVLEQFRHSQAQLAAAPAEINSQVEQAIRNVLDSTLLHSGDVAYGTRASADALAASIERINRTNRENLLRIVQLAGVAACITGMVREPDKADAYKAVLEIIGKLG